MTSPRKTVKGQPNVSNSSFSGGEKGLITPMIVYNGVLAAA